MSLLKLYYHLTAYVPRKLPSTEPEFIKFKDILLNNFDLPNEAQTYVVICGQITSTKGDKLRKSYGSIANNVKRLKINALAQCYRMAAVQELENKLAQALQKEAEKEPSQGQGDVSNNGIQEAPETMV